jgi:hypothetical protein
MARHRLTRGQGVPEQLARFVLSEWPGAACPHEAVRQWSAACTAWLAADSNRRPDPRARTEHDNLCWLSGDSNRRLPFGEWGDAIDVLREERRYREQWPPCPHEYRPATFWANGPPG